jgi:multisubunit Na+/H+ antiporter MnhC subunit
MHNEQATQTPAAPAGEELHLPKASAVPLAAAVSITLIVIGLGLTFWITALGLVGLGATLYRWIGDTRRSIAELPEAPDAE